MERFYSQSFDTIYHDMLIAAFQQNPKELNNCAFKLSDPANRLADTPAKPFNPDNAEQFFQWVYSGEDVPFSGALGKAWDVDVGGRNANYGPRILEQLDAIIDELQTIPSSRRASVLILSQDDYPFLKAKREGSKIEYPCTICLQFFMRHNLLNCTGVMRSQNLVSTVRYDVYNFTRFLQEMSSLVGVKTGTYEHIMLNAHIMEDEEALAWEFISDYMHRGQAKIPPVVHYNREKLAAKDDAIRMPSEVSCG